MEEYSPQSEYRKHIVSTFPKDTPRVESGKTPEKKNVDKQSPSDGVVKWHGEDLSAAKSAEDFRDALIEAKRKQLSECRVNKDPNAITSILPSGFKFGFSKEEGVIILPKDKEVTRPSSVKVYRHAR